MKRGRNRIWAAVVLVFALAGTLAGCNPVAKIAVVEAGRPVINGLSALNGRATVKNAGGNVMVENARIVLRYRGRELATARLVLPIEIEARSVAEIRYDFALEGLSAGTMQTVGMRLFTNPGAVTIDISGRVRWGAIRKNFERKEVPLTQIIRIFGASRTVD